MTMYNKIEDLFSDLNAEYKKLRIHNKIFRVLLVGLIAIDIVNLIKLFF